MRVLVVLAVAVSSTSGSAAEATGNSAADTIELTGDFIIPVQLNGQTYRLEVEPEGSAARVVNPDVAKAISLKPSMIGGLHNVGPVRLTAASDSVQIGYGAKTDKDRVFWFDRPASTLADGTIHPSMLPNSNVRFVLAPTVQGERETTMAFEAAGMFGIGGGYAIYKYGDIELQISFSLKRHETLMTAPVGVELAAGQGGSFSDEQRQANIRFGVERPVRTLVLARPLMLFDRPLSTGLVRVSDFGDASTIPDAGAVDPDEIVVTGKAKKKPRYSLTLGRDFLRGCSSLTYDLKAKLIRLSCLPE